MEKIIDVGNNYACGNLRDGLELEGVIHKGFKINLPVVKHTINAMQKTHASLGTTSGAAAIMRFKVELIAESIENIGAIEKSKITTEFLLDTLTDDDIDILDDAINAIKKNRRRLKQNSTTSES